LARGKSRSDTIENIVKQATEIVSQGIKEIVLTGVNTGDFGVDTDENFYQLLQALEKVEGLERIRISSIEPNLLTNEIIELVAQSKNIVPHFHIPLQSGSDKILQSMRRRYLTELYTSRVEKIKELMPHCCIGVDVIVGYPGEEHADFIDTYNYLNELNISYLHVFTYSERVNTTAYKLPGKVNLSERADRSKMLHILSDKKRLAYYNEHIGNNYPVLWEAENDADVMYGFTNNYIKVKTKYDPMLVNEIIAVEITDIDTDDMVAKCKLLQMVF